MSAIGVNRTLWVHRGIDANDPQRISSDPFRILLLRRFPAARANIGARVGSGACDAGESTDRNLGDTSHGGEGDAHRTAGADLTAAVPNADSAS